MMEGDVMSEERALSDLDDDIKSAQSALMETLSQEPDKWWNARELRVEALSHANGDASAKDHGWSGDLLTFALTDLVNQGALELDPELRVKLKAA
jgi:hypothetical protein